MSAPKINNFYAQKRLTVKHLTLILSINPFQSMNYWV